MGQGKTKRIVPEKGATISNRAEVEEGGSKPLANRYELPISSRDRRSSLHVKRRKEAFGDGLKESCKAIQN